MAISLSSLNVEKASDTPFTLAIIDESTGVATGIEIDIIGEHSKTIADLVAKAVNGKREAARMATKKGKDVPADKVEDDLLFGYELAAKRIVGWVGIEEAFTPELALELVKTNPTIREQIMTASGNVSNFTK
jgi:hypothetical protein